MQVHQSLRGNMSQTSHSEGSEDEGGSEYKLPFRYAPHQRLAMVAKIINRMTEEECDTWLRTGEMPSGHDRLVKLYHRLEDIVVDSLGWVPLPPSFIESLVSRADAAAGVKEGVEQLMEPLEPDAQEAVVEELKAIYEQGGVPCFIGIGSDR